MSIETGFTQASFALRGRNPDVLTCIANLSNDEVFTPPEFANRMLDTLTKVSTPERKGATAPEQKGATRWLGWGKCEGGPIGPPSHFRPPISRGGQGGMISPVSGLMMSVGVADPVPIRIIANLTGQKDAGAAQIAETVVHFAVEMLAGRYGGHAHAFRRVQV